MLKNISTLVLGVMLLGACHPGNYSAADVSVEELLKNEWISFHVDRYFVDADTTEKTSIDYDIVIHNLDDSTQVIANITSDGEAYLVTPRWAKYVNTQNCDLAYYRNVPDEPENTWYQELVSDALCNGLEFFPMYYPTYPEWGMVKMSEKRRAYRMMRDGKTLRVRAKTTRRFCYEDHCELKDVLLRLYYDLERGMFVAGENWLWNFNERYEIKDVCFDNRQALLDSLFDFAAPYYSHYDKTEGDVFIPSRYGTRNTEMNDTVLDFPLVNVRTGDTITLRQMEGVTLVSPAYFGVGKAYFIDPDAFAPRVRNVIMLYTESNNVDMMRSLCDSVGVADNVYYAKGINRWLDLSYNNAILIGADHRTRGAKSKGLIMPLVQWMGETLAEQ